MAARNTSMMMTNRCSASSSKYRVEKASAAVTRSDTRKARPAPKTSMAKSMPTATPWRGCHPANQYTIRPSAAWMPSTVAAAVQNAAVPTATVSTTHRGQNEANAARPAAASSGTTTGRGARASMSARHGPKVVGIHRPRRLVRLKGQCQEQRRNDHPHHDVRKDQRLHDGVDGLGSDRDVLVYGRRPSYHVSHLKDQDVGRGLHDRQAHHRVDEIATGDDSIQAHEEEPRAEYERRHALNAHPRTMRVCSRNS